VSPTPGAPRILLVRTSALGDIVQALPVLSALRRRFPTATIGWVVDESFATLLEGHGLLDELLVVPLRRWRRSSAGRAREVARFVRRLRSFRAEIALDLMGNHKGALLARASGAPRRIGLSRRDRREPVSAWWLTELCAAEAPHAVERMLAVARRLEIDGRVDFAPDQLRCGASEVPGGAYVYLHPGAAWGNKRYPAGRWGKVAAIVARESGFEVRVGAGPGEEKLADAVVAASGEGVLRHDAPTLAALAGVVRGAHLVLASDTGAAHLAGALDRPILTVHGPTDPARHGVWGQSEWCLHRSLPCSFCHRRMEDAKPCLLGVDPAAIAEAALRRLRGAAV